MENNLCQIYTLPTIEDSRGNLSFIEFGEYLPFEIKCVQWMITEFDEKEIRGYAYKNNNQLLIAISGSFELVVDNGSNHMLFKLSDTNVALFIPNMIWHKMENVSPDCIILKLSSLSNLELDCINDYNIYIELKNNVLHKNY
jgi:hypothetical protein